MDSLTQIVLGAGVAEAISGRKLGNRAILYGAIIGTIPDLDVVVGKFFDILTANEIHRGVSHSMVFFAMLTPLLGLLMRHWERRRGLTFIEASGMAFAVLLTHALLDAFTNWGTQLFWPSDHRVAIQSIFVIDPLYTLPFLYCLIRAMWIPKHDPRRMRFTRAGLYISSAYLVLSVVVQGVARHRFEQALIDQKLAYGEISVRPAPLSLVLWNANVRTDEGYLLGDYSLFDSQPIRFREFRQGEMPHGLSDDLVMKRLVRMSENWYLVTVQDGKWYFNDLRFGPIDDTARDPEFVFRYELVESPEGYRALEADSEARREPGKLLGRLWNRMWGN